VTGGGLNGTPQPGKHGGLGGKKVGGHAGNNSGCLPVLQGLFATVWLAALYVLPRVTA
jgi:hypothetical protein